MTQKVKFIQLTQEQYQNLSSKPIGNIYFTTDTHKIYKGGTVYSENNIQMLTESEWKALETKTTGVLYFISADQT